MIDWRTSRFVMLFLVLLTSVVVILAVAEVRSSRLAPTAGTGPGFSIAQLFDGLRDRFSQGDEADEEGPQVAGVMIEPIAPHFPVNIGEGNVANPFVPAPKPGGPDTTPPAGDRGEGATSSDSSQNGESAGSTGRVKGTSDDASSRSGSAFHSGLTGSGVRNATSSGSGQNGSDNVDSTEQRTERDCQTLIISLLRLNDICLTSTK